MISGWKTKTGIIIGLIGGGLLAGADICPNPAWILWIKFAGTILSFVGAGLGGYGVAHKIEKGQDKSESPQ